MSIPDTQYAVQLIGPNELTLNTEKPIHQPGPYQVLCKVEVCGLCFSDLKLLKQFSGHVRKSDVISGIDLPILQEVPTYVPNLNATVPGHETVVRIVDKGDAVQNMEIGDRYLVQADFRWLKTGQSNGAFGYNFEGALQEYVLLDQRVFTAPDGDSMLLPAAEDLPASAIALVEPWACVEDSYVVKERQTIKEGGTLLVVGDGDDAAATLAGQPNPGRVLCVNGAAVAGAEAVNLAEIDEESIDDAIVYGADADVLEAVFPLIAKNGLVNIVQCGGKFGRDVVTPVGRLHYGGVRIIGTTGSSAQDGYDAIPATGEIREGDRINIIGAGGPMGTMHVIRDICQGVPGIVVYGGDMNDERLEMLSDLAKPLAAERGVGFEAYNAGANPPAGPFGYVALMVPAPGLVAASIGQVDDKGVINIFAGIPATVSHPLDLDTFVAKQAYFIGTSGSVMEDIRIVYSKVESRSLDTNLSVAAVTVLDGAVECTRAVENQLMPGKIVVYPSCKGLGLTKLTDLPDVHPEVAEKLADGAWTKAAEDALLALYN
jgi:threonine dehydrogenase-like Zn-dependent dehydrogenase